MTRNNGYIIIQKGQAWYDGKAGGFMSDGAMIIIIFTAIILVPTAVVFIMLSINKSKRKKKNETYTGIADGTVMRIVDKGIDFPWVIHVSYMADGKRYEIKETAKLKSETIKLGPVPVGQRKIFAMGSLTEGDKVTVKYDVNRPEKAIIAGNEGVVTS